MRSLQRLPSTNLSGFLKLYIFLTLGELQVSTHFLPSLPGSLFIGHKLVDLSYPYDNDTIVWPDGQPFGYFGESAGFKSPGDYWYAANNLKTAEHCGTHLDAPYHFNKEGWKVGDIPIERLITIGAFVNVSAETNGNRHYKLPVSKLTEWERKNGPFPPNSVILVSFGWASRYGNKDEYLGPNGTLSFPGLSKEAAEWIMETQRVIGVGVDTASVDQGENVDVHIVLHGGGLYHLENVAISDVLPPMFNIIVMPMKLANGTGAPCRIVALIPDDYTGHTSYLDSK